LSVDDCPSENRTDRNSSNEFLNSRKTFGLFSALNSSHSIKEVFAIDKSSNRIEINRFNVLASKLHLSFSVNIPPTPNWNLYRQQLMLNALCFGRSDEPDRPVSVSFYS